MASDAGSSAQLEHSSSMLDFLKGTLKEVPCRSLAMSQPALLLIQLCCL